MAEPTTTSRPFARPLLGFVAGFVATVTAHQIAVALLWWLGALPAAPWSLDPTPPLGVPAVLSLSFWGGVWGIVYALVDERFPDGGGYWAVAFLFGAILPTLVALLLVLPIKGGPMGAGWQPTTWLVGFLVNGAWGVGTGLVLRLLAGRER